MSATLQDSLPDSLSTLKKIRQAKGELIGFYYAVGGSKPTEGGLVVRLLSKDPKGATCLSLGKKIAKELDLSKSSRGHVTLTDGILTFRPAASSGLGDSALQKALRQGMGNEDLQKLLKAAVVNGQEVEDKEDTKQEEKTDSLSDSQDQDEQPLSEEELQQLIEEQQKLWLEFKSKPAYISDLDDEALEKQLAQELEDELLLLLDELAESEDPELKKQLGGKRLSLKVESIELSKFSKDLEDLELGEKVDDELVDLLALLDELVDIPISPPPRKIPEGEGRKGVEVVGKLLGGGEPDEDYDPSTPFGDKDEPVGPRGPRFPQPFPPEGWLKTVGDYISGRKKKSKFFPSKDEKAALRTLEAMRGAFAQRGDIDQRSDAVRDMIHSQLGAGYTGSGAKTRQRGETRHTAEAELQQAMLVVESLLQEGTGLLGGSKGPVINAVTSLSEADQLKLFEADELSGRRLYSLLYMTAKSSPEMKPLFKKVKAASQRARIARRLDTHDRSGESSKVMEELQLHLTQSGLSEEDRQAFTDKLDFKMVLAGGQKKDPDLRLPDTSQEGWRGKFLCQSLGILAETPEISDESLRKALDLPPTDLLNMIAYAAIGDEVTHAGAQDSSRVKDGKTHHSPLVARREGESRILRVLGELVAGHLAQGETEGWTQLDQLLKGVDNGAFDAKLLQAEMKKGTSFPDILKALQKDLSDRAEELEEKAKTKYNDLKAAQELKLENLEEELKDTDRKDAREKFLELDKLRSQVKYLSKAPPTQKELEQMLTTFGRAPLRPLDGSDSDFLKVAIEVGIHLEAVRDPLLLKAGLETSGFVLPTAGKSLKDFPWIVTTAMDMVETAKKIQAVQPTFRLTRSPIIILDQTDGDGKDPNRMKLWEQNAAYIKKLNEDYAEFGLRVEHVGMGAINKLIRGSGVEKLFDTTGENNAGYGGARNIGFLLGPLVQDVIRSGEKLEDLEPEDLVERLQKCALGEGAPKLFMGDDTDSLRPGTITAKMGIAASDEYGDDYTAILTPRGGRDTQGINSGVTNNVKVLEEKGFEGFVQDIFRTNAWNINNTTPGMGCAFGEPRFCLDLPSGAEEKHCEPGKKLVDSFSQANHLSGDRKAPPAAYLRGQLAYCNTTEMVKSLFPPLWSWNTAAFKTLGTDETAQSLSDMFKYAGSPEEVGKQQESLLFNLANFSKDRSKGPLELDVSQAQAVQDYLDKHPELDMETRDELVEIKKVYVDAARQAALIDTYIQRLFGKMMPDLDLGPTLKAAFTDEDLNAFRNCISNHIKVLDRPAILGRAKDAILDALETAVTGKGKAGVQEALVNPATVLSRLRKPVQDALLGAMSEEIRTALLDPSLLLDSKPLTEDELKSKLVVSNNLDYPAGLLLKRVLSAVILTDRDVFLDAVRELRTEMKTEGIEFNGKNRLLRDLVLALESMSGGFAEIATTLTR